jgi:predicted methyltransferase
MHSHFPESTRHMKKNLAIILLFLSTATLLHAQTMSTPAYVTDAVADASRPATDKQVDNNRMPAALVTFAGIKPGDNVADVMPGGGYFTRIFSKVVGAKGHVYAVIPEAMAAKVPPEKFKSIHALVADPAYSGNTTLEIRPYDRLDVGMPLDVVWTSQNYHDVYGAVSVFSVSGSTGPEQAAKLDAAAFKALKPGGVFIVVDHAAAPGSGGRDASTLHRIDPAIVIAQAKAAGFELEGTSDVLRNPQDGHDKSVFDPAIKGHTDKFVLKFRKPATGSMADP